MSSAKDYYSIRCLSNVMKKQTKEKLLAELLKNSRRSDRELARALDSSQPTITRTRQKLEHEGLIKDYTIVADWRKLGFEIMTFTFIKMRPEIRSEEASEKVKRYSMKFPFAIYTAYGEGLEGMNGVVVALHRSYRDYMRYLSLFRTEWKDYVEDIQSFVTALGGEVKELSFTYLAKALLMFEEKTKDQ